MADVKIVFVQCEDGDSADVAKWLGSMPPDCPYYFIIASKSFAALSRNEVQEMLGDLGRALAEV